MVLVIGGLAAGKREYVRQRWGFEEKDLSCALDGAPVLVDLQELVRARPEWDQALVEALCQKQVVICNEVGCGVVPMDAAERHFREQTGRLCIELARRASQVVRVCCGVPAVIKG